MSASASKLEVLHPGGFVTDCDATFAACQAAVGGLVQPVRLSDGSLLLVNEEGLPLGLPFNPAATMIAGEELVGPAVVVPKGLVRRVLG